MMTNKELLAIAKKQIGNTGGKYRSYAGYGGSWCNMYVYWLFNANGCGSLFPMKTKYQKTYCPTSIKWCRKNLAEIPLYLAMPCDIFYMDWDKNRVPNHIGIAERHDTAGAIYTIEGNTSGGKVDDKHREGKYNCGLFRPHFKPSKMPTKGPLAIDGDYAYNSIYMTQVVLGLTPDAILGKTTVKRIQSYFGASTQDGAWGAKTSKAIQGKLAKEGYYTGKIDGAFGPASVKGLQKWINAKYRSMTEQTPAPTPTPTEPAKVTNAQKIVNKANELAWPYGTPSSKWDYKKGAPTSKCKAAMKKYGYTSRGKMSSCAYFANTVVRESGVNKSIGLLHGYKKAFPKTEKGFNTVLSGRRIPENFLQPGDIVRYKKTSKDEHVLIYMGSGRICEARHYHRFGNIYKDEHRYNGSNVKKSTIQVLRAK